MFHMVVMYLQDRKAIIWRCSNVDQRQWSAQELVAFDDILWHVSWSLCATVLAVSGSDNEVITGN